MSEINPILSFLRISGNDARLLLKGVSGAGGALTMKWAVIFGFMLALLWYIQQKLSSQNQQTGLPRGKRMIKDISVSLATFVTNATTALYVNNLPALSIRASSKPTDKAF